MQTAIEAKYGDLIAHTEVIAPKEASYAPSLPEFSPQILEYLERNKIRLYSHQAEAAELSLAGHNVMITTPTSSGKTLAFNLPVVDALIRNDKATALYLYPLKALAQDQHKTLIELERDINILFAPAIYDGDTSGHQRQRIRENSRITLTNPYALHQYLPWHHKWKRFFGNFALCGARRVARLSRRLWLKCGDDVATTSAHRRPLRSRSAIYSLFSHVGQPRRAQQKSDWATL